MKYIAKFADGTEISRNSDHEYKFCARGFYTNGGFQVVFSATRDGALSAIASKMKPYDVRRGDCSLSARKAIAINEATIANARIEVCEII